MNLTVPRDRLFEQPDGTWWFIVEAERWYYATTTSGELDGEVVRPPGYLVALAAPCESNDCEGGRLWDDREMPCPDCADRTLTIETECEHDGPVVGCNRCKSSSGTVSLGQFRIETPMPIVADSEDVGSAYWGPACIEAHANGARHYPAWDGALEYDDGQDINLGPDPARFVGQFAVKAVPA